MKVKRFLFGLLLIISMIFVTVVEAESAPDDFEISASDLTMLYGSNYLPASSTLQFTYKRTTGGKIIYCTEIHDKMTSTKETYSRGTEASSRIAYILANGYPNKSITGDNNKDYFITGIAIWMVLHPNDISVTYFDASHGTYKGEYNTVTQQIAKLVNESSSYTNVSSTLTAKKTSVNLTLSSDKKNYVTPQLGVTTTGTVGNYTVSLKNAPTGTKVTDVNGNVKNTFAKGASFLVSVPASSISTLSTSFDISISATGTDNKAYNYIASDSAHQNVVTLYKESKSLSTSIKVHLTLSNNVSISKQDITNSKELSGATLELTKPDGTKETWVSGTSPKVFTNLPIGKYTLTEENAPDGYVKSSETITFNIKSDGTPDKNPIVMKNQPKGNVYISKQDATTGKELPGASLVLKDSKGNVVDSWTSDVVSHKVEKILSAGKYTLTETIAPDGYVKSSKTVTFTVKEDGTTDGVVIMENEPEKVSENPKTGTTLMFSLMIAFVAFAVSFYYYADYRLKSNM